jgi:amino acid transporter
VFYGYDASAHLAEETLQASDAVAKGIWVSPFSAWILSVPTLIIILFCLQDFEGIISATYANNWGEYLAQVVGQKGAVAILGMLWVDSTCATASCLLSAQRVTYAISRDHVLPFSSFFRKLSKRKMAVNAAWLVYFISVAITCAVIGSTVAFSAVTATATIATNASYVFPLSRDTRRAERPLCPPSGTGADSRCRWPSRRASTSASCSRSCCCRHCTP